MTEPDKVLSKALRTGIFPQLSQMIVFPSLSPKNKYYNWISCLNRWGFLLRWNWQQWFPPYVLGSMHNYGDRRDSSQLLKFANNKLSISSPRGLKVNRRTLVRFLDKEENYKLYVIKMFYFTYFSRRHYLNYIYYNIT